MSRQIEHLEAAIRDVENFPKDGILFKDITPILQDGSLFAEALELLAAPARDLGVTKVVGIDARGFIFGAPVAHILGAGFVPIRKQGKLPYRTIGRNYELEYGEATVEMHEDSIQPGEKVLLVDDLLATGGTAAAAIQLLNELQAELVGVHFLIELDFLKGRDKLPTQAPLRSILHY